MAPDETAVKVWGPGMRVAPGETKKIGWDDSAALFRKRPAAALLQQVKGDGEFTLYAMGGTGVVHVPRGPAARWWW